jgi:uncharacterized protein (UPF0335 family)
MSDTSNQSLKSFVDGLEYIDQQRVGLTADFNERLKAAKDAGFNPKIIRKLLKKRKEDQIKAAEEQRELELYEAAMGPLMGTDLGNAAKPRAA